MEYEIMSGDTVVAKVNEDGKLDVVEQDLLPYRLERVPNFEEWAKTRLIDNSRQNSRTLRKLLGLVRLDVDHTIINNNLSSITDNYWVRIEGEETEYKDIVFKDNPYFQTSLYGDFHDKYLEPAPPTPDLTTVGSYEKGWKFEEGKWWLYKNQSKYENFSELFTYNLGKQLGFNMAHYSYVSDNTIKTRDFTEGKYNLEHMESLVGDIEDYSFNVDVLNTFGNRMVEDYLNIIFLDTVVFNVDRHTFNYGILRCRETGKIVCMAPNYDNNLSLIARGFPRNIERSNDLMLKLFNQLEVDYTIPYLNKDIINEAYINTIKSYPTNIFSKEERDIITDFCYNGYLKVK